MAFDPLSSAGIYKAMDTGRRAAEALTAPDPQGALATYAEQMEEDFVKYLNLKASLYRAETRWPDAEFWRQRVAQPVAAQ